MPIDRNVYFFGNSLVNYAQGGPLANVPAWMNQFAAADSNGFGAEGGYGFLRNFADRSEPLTDWGFAGVDSVINGASTRFAQADFDAIVITPANFIQDQAPWENYFDEARSPLEAAIETVGNMRAQQPDARLFVYEGWADMGPYAPNGAPTAPALAAYHRYNQGDYHAWYETLVDVTNAETGAEVALIPVASILSDLLEGPFLAQIPFDDLYVDSAPHGTETIYFLASMITYAAIYGELPPPDFMISRQVHPIVHNHFADISADISDALAEAGFETRIPQPGDDNGFVRFQNARVANTPEAADTGESITLSAQAQGEEFIFAKARTIDSDAAPAQDSFDLLPYEYHDGQEAPPTAPASQVPQADPLLMLQDAFDDLF